MPRQPGLDTPGALHHVRARGIEKREDFLSRLAVRRMGYSGAEAARYLGVTTSAVNRLPLFGELADVHECPELFSYQRCHT